MKVALELGVPSPTDVDADTVTVYFVYVSKLVMLADKLVDVILFLGEWLPA